ncbi:MAG: DUF1893 domain-containing protein [Ruminococcaceae bacterium]|nr:DUF1893 domain-containing protein [Oscillospiraceae bacterium]
MNKNLEKAKELLIAEELTCCFTDGNRVYKSRERGVKPLLSYLDEGIDTKDLCAADKVIGKAAAFLYVLLGIKWVYADVISQKALEVFRKYGVEISFSTLVPAIRNRTNTGFCPMETAVENINEPQAALEAIKEKLKELSGNK